MSCLPAHGRVECTLCHRQPVVFDSTTTQEGDWRIRANPLAWGNPEAEVVVLGFSKGPRQAYALATSPHDEIAYNPGRKKVGKIFAHVGLIQTAEPDSLSKGVDDLIADRRGRFHFGSLVRCTVERFDQSPKAKGWVGTGGGMLDKFIKTDFGQQIARRCTSRFLSNLPDRTKLVVMFGLGTKGNYVREARLLFERARPGSWRNVNEVAYTDQKITVVHVEHFAAQGALIPDWLGETGKPRARLGLLARAAIEGALT